MNEKIKRSFISPLAPKLSLVIVNSYIELFDFAQILLYMSDYGTISLVEIFGIARIIVGISTGRCIHRSVYPPQITITVENI